MDKETILVTGATDNVGRQVVSQLLRTAAVVRALTRNPDSSGLPSNVEVLRGDLSDSNTLDACLKGVDAVYLVWPFLPTDFAPAVLDAVKRYSRRIVFQSLSSVRDDLEQQTDPISQFHAEIEHLIERSGLWTFLRFGGFATNTLQWTPQIRAEGVVRWVWGAAARSLIHERDIAAASVRALTGDGHGAAKYVLTGPQALTQVEQIHTIGDVIGRPLRYDEISPEAGRQEMVTKWGWPASLADGVLNYWATLVTEPELVTSTVEQITGAPARTFREWVIDHAGDFRWPSA